MSERISQRGPAGGRSVLWKTRQLGYSVRPGSALLSEGKGCWRGCEMPAYFDLLPEKGYLPAGWLLIKGRVARARGGPSARVWFDTGRGTADTEGFPIPITLKGVIHELIELPMGVAGIRFQLLGSPGEFSFASLALRKVGELERIWRMWRRVLPIFFKQPPERRARVDVTLWRCIVDLPHAYRMAGRLTRHYPPLPYADWRRKFASLSPTDIESIRRHIERFPSRPLFRVIIHAAEHDLGAVEQTLASLEQQIYRHFTAVLLDPNERFVGSFDGAPGVRAQRRLRYVSGNVEVAGFLRELEGVLAGEGRSDYVVVVAPGDRLSEHALYWAAHEVVSNPDLAVVYSDEDEVTRAGEHAAPKFKPDWSPEHLRSSNYVGGLAALRGQDVHRAGGLRDGLHPEHALDLLLRLSEVVEARAVKHVPAVLYHRHRHLGSDAPGSSQNDVRALSAHLARRGVAAEITASAPARFKVRYALPNPAPMVSIVIPTRDSLTLLRRCVESVLSKSTYRRLEIIVVDNLSTDPAALSYLAALERKEGVRVFRYDRAFNFSAMNNFAARHARGEVLCLLNNDTEVITPDWMEEMLGHLCQERVGVVGAKLYFLDGRVQHAGDVVGPGGCADHLHRLIGRDAPGYCNRALLAQELSAVTGACLMTWKHLYDRLGGLDEAHLPIAFSDVDYCLKVQEAGFRVVWTPYAELYHHESSSRGKDDSREKFIQTRRQADYIRRRWRHRMWHDPYYNPNLSYERPDFSLSNAPMVRRPWIETAAPPWKRVMGGLYQRGQDVRSRAHSASGASR